MPGKKSSPKKIISLLRQIEDQMASGVTLPQACKQAQISTQSYYCTSWCMRWMTANTRMDLNSRKSLWPLATKDRCEVQAPARPSNQAATDGGPIGGHNLMDPCMPTNNARTTLLAPPRTKRPVLG